MRRPGRFRGRCSGTVRSPAPRLGTMVPSPRRALGRKPGFFCYLGVFPLLMGSRSGLFDSLCPRKMGFESSELLCFRDRRVGVQAGSVPALPSLRSAKRKDAGGGNESRRSAVGTFSVND